MLPKSRLRMHLAYAAFVAYAGHVLVFGGVSPLRVRESEPSSEGKGVTARLGLKEAGAAVTTRRTETG